MTRLQFGAKVPNNETVLTPERLRQFARGLEDIGFDHLSMDDHVAIAPVEAFHSNPAGFTTVRAQHELFTAFAFLAGITSTLQLRSGILILPQRQTVLVARQAAEVDVLSNGRLTLGVGLGWNPLEFDVLGEAFSRRARRFEPQIELLRQLWTEEYVTLDDEWNRLDRTGILPRPVQQPIPIWIGASADSAIRRAARIADGFMALGRIGDSAEHQVATYKEERQRLDLEPSAIQLEGWIDLDTDRESTWRASAEAWQDLGATHITLVTPARPVVSIEAHLELLQRGLAAVSG